MPTLSKCPIRMNVNYSENTSMKASPNNKKFERVVRRIDPQSRLLRAWELKGGVSARVTALEIERPDEHTRKMIVRQHGEVDRKHNPQIAADEFHLSSSYASVRNSPGRWLETGCVISTSTRTKICRKVESAIGKRV